MKKIISVLLCAMLMMVAILWMPETTAYADNKDEPIKLELGKKAKDRLEGGIARKYQISLNQVGVLSITVRSYVNDTLHISLYSSENPQDKLYKEVQPDETKGYTDIEYTFYANPGTYYLELSNPILLLGGEFTIDTDFTRIHAVGNTADNHSIETAQKLSNHKYNLGVLSFDEVTDYYSVTFKKASQFKLSVFCIEDTSLDITIMNSEGKVVHEGWGNDKSKPYTFDEFVEAGKYIIAVKRNNEASDPYGLSYAVVTGSYVPITKIKLPASKAMKAGEVYTFKPTLTPSKATGDYYFTSSDEKIVRITEGGKATALKKGTATITVTTIDGKLKATCKVTVQDNTVTKITLNKTQLTLNDGSSATLKATIVPSTAKKTVTWKSSNTKIATVNSSGKVTAKGVGTCKITASAGGKSATATITVKAKPTPTPTPKPTPKPTATPMPTPKPTVTATPTPTPIPKEATDIEVNGVSMTKSVKITVGDSKTIAVTILPSNATNKTLVWSCTDNTVVTVENGKITGMKAGTATVVVTSANGKKAYCTVIVSE